MHDGIILTPDITIISAVYPPEPQVTARMSQDLAGNLANRGYFVTVLCPQPSRPINADYSKYICSASCIVSFENNVRVVRLPSYAAPQSRLLPRLYESFSFGWWVIKYLAVEQKPSVLYVNSWPLIAQAIIANYAKRNNIPLVLQIMDVYPEALTNKLPALLQPLGYLPLKKLDTLTSQMATSIVVISDNMRRIYTESRRVSRARIATIPTWQDEKAFDNIPSRIECCNRYGIPHYPFTFLYLGNIGPVAGVDFLIRAFSTANIPDSQLVIVGDGTAKSDCMALAKQLNLPSVLFVSDPLAVNVPSLQNMAHVCLLPMKRGAGMSSIPSKLPSYLFSAKPVIATVDDDSDTARFVRESECGWVGDAEDLTWLVATMRKVSCLSSSQLGAVGKRGKEYGVSHFSKSTCVARLAETIIRSAGNGV